MYLKMLVAQSCLTLCDPMDCSFSSWISPGKNTGVGCHFLLQGILPTQGSNSGLPRCGQRSISFPPIPKGSFFFYVRVPPLTRYHAYSCSKSYSVSTAASELFHPHKPTTKTSGSVANLLFLLCHPRMRYTVKNSVHKLLGFILSLLSREKIEMWLNSVYFYFLSVPNDLF